MRSRMRRVSKAVRSGCIGATKGCKTLNFSRMSRRNWGCARYASNASAYKEKPTMDRRHALMGIAGLALARAHAQAPAQMRRIGYLGPSAETAPRLLQAFKDGLAELGYRDGRNVV